ncbi:MAG: tRNA lysidine(34) synthetase TilS [Ignavibacteriales bacterium]|nr:tRNA lysidine(34) synthetase TilS [Ignavibacteriales bacterium]
MRNLEQKVIKFIDQNLLIEPSNKLLIAFSGGPDSTFLIYFFEKYKRRFKIDLYAAYIDHQLREDSKNELTFCKEFCEQLKIPFYSRSVNVKKCAKECKISIEEAARNLRYQKLEELSKKLSCNKIVLGHTKNDNTETILLNLIKGTGLSGIAGIPIKRKNIIRPILALSKYEILGYLKFNKINYCFDDSNLSDEFERNFLRNKIIPQLKNKINPSLDDSLLKSSIVIQKENELIKCIIDDLYAVFIKKEKNKFSVDLSIKKIFDDIYISEIFKKLLKSELKLDVSTNIISSLIELTKKQRGKKIKLCSDYVAIKENDWIIVKKETENIICKSIKIKIGEKIYFNQGVIEISRVLNKEKFNRKKNIEFISGDFLRGDFLLRAWRSGDKFTPLGMKGEKKIADFLAEQKTPNEIKKNQFVLINNGKIVWVVNYRINEKYKILNSTKRIIKLCVKMKQI